MTLDAAISKKDDFVPRLSPADETISTGLNPLLFDRSHAGAIACRREVMDRLARGDNSVPRPSLANEATATGLNPLLLDRSPAGAIACRREVMDRLARVDDSVPRPSLANEATSTGQTRKTVGGRTTGQPASPMAMSPPHALGSMGFPISSQLECYAKIPDQVAQVPPAHAPAQPLRYKAPPPVPPAHAPAQPLRYKAPPPQIFLAKWKAPPECLRDREGNPLCNRPIGNFIGELYDIGATEHITRGY